MVIGAKKGVGNIWRNQTIINKKILHLKINKDSWTWIIIA
jgi:hypothetical protein